MTVRLTGCRFMTCAPRCPGCEPCTCSEALGVPVTGPGRSPRPPLPPCPGLRWMLGVLNVILDWVLLCKIVTLILAVTPQRCNHLHFADE